MIMAHQPMSTLHSYVSGVKRPGMHMHRTPLSDALRAVTVGEYGGFSITDFDVAVVHDDGRAAKVLALVESKAKLVDLRGNPVVDRPPQEAFWFYLARTVGFRFFKVLESETVPAASDITSLEYDPFRASVSHQYYPATPWQPQVIVNGACVVPCRTRIYVLYASDNRINNSWRSPLRNFGVLAFIVEALDDSPDNRDLRICAHLIQKLAPTQCIEPLLISVRVSKPNVDEVDPVPWTLRLHAVDTRQIYDSTSLPQIPAEPAAHLTDARVQAWQTQWRETLDLTARFRRLRDQAVHRSLREQGQAFCHRCIVGECTRCDHHVLTR